MHRCILLLLVNLSLFLAVNSAIADEDLLHQGGTKMSGYQRTLVCDYCEKTRELWFAVLVNRHWGIPLIYPQQQTIVFCYDTDNDKLTLEFQISQMIFEIIADESGIIYTKDHGMFLDETMCYYSKTEKKSSVLKPNALVGRLIAISDNSVYFLGTSAYGDGSVYRYDTDTQITVKILNINSNMKYKVFSDESHLYIANSDDREVEIYDLYQDAISKAILPDDPVIAMGNDMLITDKLELYQIGESGADYIFGFSGFESNKIYASIEKNKIYLYNGRELFVFKPIVTSEPPLHFEIQDADNLLNLCGHMAIYINSMDKSLNIINLLNMKTTSFVLPL